MVNTWKRKKRTTRILNLQCIEGPQVPQYTLMFVDVLKCSWHGNFVATHLVVSWHWWNSVGMALAAIDGGRSWLGLKGEVTVVRWCWWWKSRATNILQLFVLFNFQWSLNWLWQFQSLTVSTLTTTMTINGAPQNKIGKCFLLLFQLLTSFFLRLHFLFTMTMMAIWDCQQCP
jgi:hypothetical protein